MSTFELFFQVQLANGCYAQGCSSDGCYAECYCVYSKTGFLVQIKFITDYLQQTQTQTLIIN